MHLNTLLEYFTLFSCKWVFVFNFINIIQSRIIWVLSMLKFYNCLIISKYYLIKSSIYLIKRFLDFTLHISCFSDDIASNICLMTTFICNHKLCCLINTIDIIICWISIFKYIQWKFRITTKYTWICIKHTIFIVISKSKRYKCIMISNEILIDIFVV